MNPLDPHAVVREVDELADSLGMPVDEGIKPLVVALRVWHFPTDGSCEGHLPPRESLQYPWGDIYAPEEEAKKWRATHASLRQRLEDLIAAYYESAHAKDLFDFQPIGIFGAFRLIPKGCEDISSSPAQLAVWRQQFNDFAAYLLERAN